MESIDLLPTLAELLWDTTLEDVQGLRVLGYVGQGGLQTGAIRRWPDVNGGRVGPA